METETIFFVNALQEAPDKIDVMREVWLHWLNETVDHWKMDHLIWEHLHR